MLVVKSPKQRGRLSYVVQTAADVVERDLTAMLAGPVFEWNPPYRTRLLQRVIPVGVRKICAWCIDYDSIFHNETDGVTIVARDPTEDRRLQAVLRHKMVFEGKAIAEASSEARRPRRLLPGVGDPAEIVHDVVARDDPAVLARRPDAVLKEPLQFDKF